MQVAIFECVSVKLDEFIMEMLNDFPSPLGQLRLKIREPWRHEIVGCEDMSCSKLDYVTHTFETLTDQFCFPMEWKQNTCLWTVLHDWSPRPMFKLHIFPNYHVIDQMLKHAQRNIFTCLFQTNVSKDVFPVVISYLFSSDSFISQFMCTIDVHPILKRFVEIHIQGMIPTSSKVL